MVSVVVATYNGEKYIEAQLRSILDQTLTADEVLIFDDGSTDATVETVSRFIEENSLNSWKLIKNKHNKGYCKNFLEGAMQTKGDFVFFSDQDDLWHKEKLETMTKVLQNDDELKAICCACDLIDSKGNKIGSAENIGVLFTKNDDSIDIFDAQKFVGRSFIRGCSLGFRRELLGFITPIDLKGLLSHDWLVTFTAALVGKCGVLNRVLMSYRCHGENTSFGDRKYGNTALQKRIEALECSVDGHLFVLENADSYPNMTECLIKKVKEHISFERKRVDYLKNGGCMRFFRCFFALQNYKCYHGSLKGAVRVFAGDFLYRKKM